jgi:hypothetical protein
VLIDRVLPVVIERAITADNVSQVAQLGFDHLDMCPVFYGLSAATQSHFPEECDYLTGKAWGLLSEKGKIHTILTTRKRKGVTDPSIPVGFVIVQSPKDLTRVLEEVPMQAIQVRPRCATNVPNMVLTYRVSPGANSAAHATAKFIAELKNLARQVPDAKELLGRRLIDFKDELDIEVRKGLEDFDLVLEPGAVRQAITSGEHEEE